MFGVIESVLAEFAATGIRRLIGFLRDRRVTPDGGFEGEIRQIRLPDDPDFEAASTLLQACFADVPWTCDDPDDIADWLRLYPDEEILLVAKYRGLVGAVLYGSYCSADRIFFLSSLCSVGYLDRNAEPYFRAGRAIRELIWLLNGLRLGPLRGCRELVFEVDPNSLDRVRYFSRTVRQFGGAAWILSPHYTQPRLHRRSGPEPRHLLIYCRLPFAARRSVRVRKRPPPSMPVPYDEISTLNRTEVRRIADCVFEHAYADSYPDDAVYRSHVMSLRDGFMQHVGDEVVLRPLALWAGDASTDRH